MPLIIPEARLLAERLEAAQQLGMTVRRLLRLEAGDPAREPEVQTGRGHRRRSAGARPAPDDVTLKARAFSGSGLKCLRQHACFTNIQTKPDMRAEEGPNRMLRSKWDCNVLFHVHVVLSSLHMQHCQCLQEVFHLQAHVIRMLQNMNIVLNASMYICCGHERSRALAAGRQSCRDIMLRPCNGRLQFLRGPG